MTTGEVAKKLVEFCNKGENHKAMEQLYSPNIVSVEAMEMHGMPREIKGIDAVKKKSEWWINNHVVHSAKCLGPYVAVDKFSVIFEYDVTHKPTAKRMKMNEVAVFTVANGKIVHEEFLYAE